MTLRRPQGVQRTASLYIWAPSSPRRPNRAPESPEELEGRKLGQTGDKMADLRPLVADGLLFGIGGGHCSGAGTDSAGCGIFTLLNFSARTFLTVLSSPEPASFSMSRRQRARPTLPAMTRIARRKPAPGLAPIAAAAWSSLRPSGPAPDNEPTALRGYKSCIECGIIIP